MLHKTNGIVLRTIKYGEHSIITTIFTQLYGVQTYMVQGVRSSRSGRNKAAFFQPGTMLDLVVYQQPNKNLQRIKEFQALYIYSTLQEDVIRNSVLLFSAELLLRLLPEHAPLPELFQFVQEYFMTLDKSAQAEVANFPLYFIIHCSREFGYELTGTYSAKTPYLNLQDGGYTSHAPALSTNITGEDAAALSNMLKAGSYAEVRQVHMNADMRMRLLDWFVAFLQRHTEHMGNIRSLPVLRTVLH